MRPDEARDYRAYRKQRFANRVRQLKKTWKIYYRSGYGKVGFWILMVFVAMTVLSPVLTFYNPTYFIAPIEDSYAPLQEVNYHLPFPATSNSTPLDPSAVAIGVFGSDVVYVIGSNGSVSAIGLGSTPTTPLDKVLPVYTPDFAAGSTVVGGEVVPLADYASFIGSYTFAYTEYVVVGAVHGNSSEVDLAHIEWTGSNGPGDGTPYSTGAESMTVNGTLLGPPTTDALSPNPIPAWGPFASSTSYTSADLKTAYVYTVTRSDDAVYLSAYYAVPFAPVWSERLPGNASPSAPVFLGSFFAPPDGTTSTSLLISQGSTVLEYNATDGDLRWSTNLTGPVDAAIAPVIPYDYQIGSLNASNSVFVALSGNPGEVVQLNLGTGAPSNVTKVPSAVEGIGTTLGDTGYPAYIAVLTLKQAYFLAGPGAVASSADSFPTPTGFGASAFDPVYDPDANLMILQSNTGDYIAIDPALGTDPVAWSFQLTPTPRSVSDPVLLTDADTGKESIAVVTSGNVLSVMADVGVDQNPLPPELHSPSGNVYLLGTNTAGNDIWSQFVASFAWDWAVGLSVAAGIMLLSIVVAMYIGYVGNWLATVVETVTLVLFLLPGLALLIVVASIAGASFTNLVLILTVLGWPFTAFTLIGVVRTVRSRTFIEAAKVSGAGTLQILRRHMLPSMTPLLAYLTALSIGGAATALSTLQFIGVAPLTIPTWGGMLEPFFANFYLAARSPWWVWPPTLALTFFVFAFVFISRGLDEVVNPRIRSR